MNQPITAAVSPKSADAADASAADRSLLGRWVSMYMQLSKIRLTALVVLTAMVGFVLGSSGPINWSVMAAMMLGVLLASSAASAFNQVLEIARDAKMPRTQGRPLPSGRMSPLHALVFGILAAGLGLSIQAAYVNLLAAGLTALTIFTYVAIYTPLKPRSTMNTLVGAVVGALPPMIGYAAAAGEIGPGAWVLAALLFVWQIPHFLALAWLYRRDYELGGYRMLPSMDPSGAITGRMIVMWSLALMPIGFVAMLVGLSGAICAIGSVLLGAWLVRLGFRVHHERTDASARRLFLATLAYLPLLMGLMVLDRAPAAPQVIDTAAARHVILLPTADAAPVSAAPVVAPAATSPAAEPVEAAGASLR